MAGTTACNVSDPSSLLMFMQTSFGCAKVAKVKGCAWLDAHQSPDRPHSPTVNGFQIEAVVLSPFLSEAKLRVNCTPCQQRMGKEPKSRRHACPQCDYKTGNVSNLRKHVRVVHEKRRDHACPQCDAAFGEEIGRAHV